MEELMPEIEPDELAYKIDDKYFAIQRTEEGYDYTFYALNYDEIDGGAYDNPDISIKRFILCFLTMHYLKIPLLEISFKELITIS